MKAEVDVKVRGGLTTFKGFEKYTFVNETESFYPTEMSLFSGPLSSEGMANVGFGPLSELSSQQMMNATFTTKVFEQGGDFSIASFRSQLSPYARYVGVQLPETASNMAVTTIRAKTGSSISPWSMRTERPISLSFRSTMPSISWIPIGGGRVRMNTVYSVMLQELTNAR